ncbi:16S rRNA (adenine(1518)-N(6)/adenine(1519)-N(6))-dimethyltransferase [Suicoccus acidiformans]|uniref:Ribosomal RNA small subunit methyltransferase A n=1 Tax=Suicoccus acidiformans TaxID=2036206 RepID=A0A347WN88_9LACT|nr:16S rRNA (adenine(1518)-N(6)/adenine(1519)-N(6))-dimethyltransferase RsmA [Suicoccus acidiformans]AXY26545.1 16S rRNA (adenine(1518)-N(6)/adenine(1519)-N(6))-dimethyltransferase [Suicoccus acidiformans]
MSTNHKLIASPSRTTEIMQTYGIQMKKSLGQNFIIESQILDKMLLAGDVDAQTTVIEIGPGIGALTEVLARQAKQVVAFEIDQRFIDILAETLRPYENVQVVHQDILEVDFDHPSLRFLQEAERLVVIANLPYYITTPIIMHLMGSSLPFDKLVMMMQKEVAERMTAPVGSKAYGSLTIAIENTMHASVAFTVPKTVFIPQPNVDSAVLVLKRRAEPLVELADPEAFQSFVKSAFSQRRKTLRNNLRAAYKGTDVLNEHIEAAFIQAGIDGTRRAETLSLQEFAALYQTLS